MHARDPRLAAAASRAGPSGSRTGVMVSSVSYHRAMLRCTLEYWIDDGWHVGRLREVPGIFSQGETLDELIENIRDAYRLMTSDEILNLDQDRVVREVEVEV